MSVKASEEKRNTAPDADDIGEDVRDGIIINASGHAQELDRNFGLFSICATGIVIGNTWAALGSSIVSTLSLISFLGN